MKRILALLTLSFMLGGGAVSPAVAKGPGEFVSTLFLHLCLMHLPNYEEADLALEAAGYEFVAYGDNEYEFSHSSNGVRGAFQISKDGEENAGCSIFHEDLSRDEMRELGLEVIREYSGEEPSIWFYNGQQGGWTVPYKERILYVIFNEGGLSSDIRDE